MVLVRYGSASEFEAVVGETLMAHEAEHNLLLGLISILKGDARFYGDLPYFGAVLHGGRVQVAALMTPPHPVVVSLTTDEPALSVLVADVREFRRATPGVNSLTPTAERFARAWQRLTGDQVDRRMAERIYRLSKLVPPRGVSGQGRQIDRADVELLARWSVAFEVEAMGNGRTIEEGRKEIETRIASDPRERGMFVWEDEGQIVCMAGYGGPTPNSLRIGPVYTPPQHRRKGYAAACTAAACEWILGPAGKSFATLFADQANATSNGVYRRIGFEPVCEAEMWTFCVGTVASEPWPTRRPVHQMWREGSRTTRPPTSPRASSGDGRA